MSDGAIAFEQRLWLTKLQAMQPERPILAQPWLGDKDGSKQTSWRPWNEYPPTVRFWTRGILLNELVCDADSTDKALNARIAGSWAASARDLGAVPLGPLDSAGRGSHVHVWYDIDRLYLDEKLLAACEKHGIDVWKLIRETLWGLICAKLDSTWVAELDEGKVRWSSSKLGSMVRDFGSPGGLGYEKRATPERLTPHELPQLWDVTPYRAQIEAALSAAVDRAKHAKEVAKEARKSLKEAKSALLAHPCVAEALKNGAPVGERGLTGLHLLKLCRAEGLTAEQATAIAEEYQRACEKRAPMTDDVIGKVAYVYDGDVSRIKCPNPMGLTVCEVSSSCPKRRFCLTS